MTQPENKRSRRRRFLQSTGGLITGALCTGFARSGELPKISKPQATVGDPIEPDWRERLTIQVGPQKGDLIGANDRVIQAAVDYVARLGGGTVQVLPGTYRLRNAIYLQSKVRILGCRADSVLVKEPSMSCKLATSAD